MTEFLTENTSLPPYMVFPRFLLDMELNETTKLLYMVLLDRARLSLKNEGWTDTSGHVFLYFTIEAMAEVLHKSQMTIKTSLAALERQDLILRSSPLGKCRYREILLCWLYCQCPPGKRRSGADDEFLPDPEYPDRNALRRQEPVHLQSEPIQPADH